MRFGTLSLAALSTRSADTGLEESRSAGGVENIDCMKGYLNHRAELDPIQLRLLEITHYHAAHVPQTIPVAARQRPVAENAQLEQLYGLAPLHEWLEAKNRSRTAPLPTYRTLSTQPNP